MGLFHKKRQAEIQFDPARQEPAVRRSICTGEMTAGFVDKDTGKFHELMRVDQAGLEEFKRQTGADKLKTIY